MVLSYAEAMKKKPAVIPPSNAPAIKPRKRKGTKGHQPHQPHRQPPVTSVKAAPAPIPTFDSTKDFPALGTACEQPKPTVAKPTWKIRGASSNAPAPAPQVPLKKSPHGNSNKTMKKKPAPESVVPDARSAAMFFQPKLDVPRDGDEHKLLRLLEDRNVYQKKGRQRLRPRMKTFSALKKKVLQERLRKWQELHPEENEDLCVSCSVCIYNYVQKEELEDTDEFKEIWDNLVDMANKIGPTKEVFIPQELERSDNYPSFVRFEYSKDAAVAHACWEGLVVSGSKLRCVLLREPPGIGDWKKEILAIESNADDLVDMSQDNATTILITDFLNEDDYADEDCMRESLSDLRVVAEKFGVVQKLEPGAATDGSVYVTFNGQQAVARILEDLQNETIGGKKLSASIASLPVISYEVGKSIVVLENVLTKDDMEDEDCMEETLTDIRELGGRYGTINALEVAGTVIKIFFNGSPSVAHNCAAALHGMTLAGAPVIARVYSDLDESATDTLYLQNILTDDDLGDEDCLEESLNDIRNLASRHGTLKDLSIVKEDETFAVKVTYQEGMVAVAKALAELEGMVVGGQIVVATRHWGKQVASAKVAEPVASDAKRKTGSPGGTVMSNKKGRTDDLKPMYAGDKIVPERFAEAKRVPKISNAPGPRPYAKIVNNETVRPLLTEMLGELMRLQKRAIEENNTKAKRRLVLGLREVARGIRSHKVKMVVMANNLDEYGVIDEKLQEIIDLAHNEAVPLFYEFTKRGLGKAVGKSIKIAVVGIQNADGAHQPFKKLVTLATSS
jgi:ribosomal protein L7Ae-like RNA K-turn-binding protein